MRCFDPFPDSFKRCASGSPPMKRHLSIYLDTSPSRSTGQTYLLALRDQVKALRITLPEADHDRFERAVLAAETYLAHGFRPSSPTTAIFASPAANGVDAVAIPEYLPESLTWDVLPYIEPLEEVVEDDETDRGGTL